MGWSGVQQGLWAKQVVREVGGTGKAITAWEEEWAWTEEWEGKWEEDRWKCLWEEMKGEAIQWEVVGSRAMIWTSEEEGAIAGESLNMYKDLENFTILSQLWHDGNAHV